MVYWIKKNKKAKNFRKYQTQSTAQPVPIQCFNLMRRLSDVADFNHAKRIAYIGTWNLSFLPNELKNFSFFHLNMKHTFNFHRSRFQNIPAECTFCLLSPSPGPIDPETFKHIFLNCRFVKPLIIKYFSNLTTINCSYNNILAVGCQFGSPLYYILNLEVVLFCHYIFQCKKMKKLPTFVGFLQSAFYLKKTMLRNSKRYLLDYNLLSEKFGVDLVLHNKWLDFF